MHSSVVAEESRLRLILDSDGLADASSPLSTPGTDIPEVNMEDDISDMVSDETVELDVSGSNKGDSIVKVKLV